MNVDYRSVAIQAAYEAGKILKDSFNSDIAVEGKGAHDIVSEVDYHSEQIIIQIIRSSFPEHTIVAEESGKSHTESE